MYAVELETIDTTESNTFVSLIAFWIFSVSVGAFVIGLSQISSFLSYIVPRFTSVNR